MRRLSAILVLAIVSCAQALPFRAQERAGSWDQPLEPCWRFASGSMSSIPTASDNVSQIFLPQTPARIIALSLLGGGLLWTVETGGDLIVPPYAYSRDIVVYSVQTEEGEKASIRRINIDSLSGIATSGAKLDVSEMRSSAGLPEALVVLDGSGNVRKFGKQGQEWERRLVSADHSGVDHSDGYIFVWSRSGEVVVLDADTGRTELEFALTSEPSGSFAVDSDAFYAGSEDGKVFAIDRGDGKIEWISRTGGTIDGLTAEKEGILAVSRDNFVYFLSDGNGSRIWKRKLAGRIIGSVKLGKEVAAFLSYGTNEVLILRMEDGRPVNRFPVEGAQHFVSAPLEAGGLLLVPFDSGLAAFAPKGVCENKKDGS